MNTTQQTGLYGTLALLAVAFAAKFGLQLDAQNITVLLTGLGASLATAVHHSGHVDRMAQSQQPTPAAPQQ